MCFWHLVGGGLLNVDDAKHPPMYRAAPTKEKYPVQNVTSVEVEKPWIRVKPLTEKVK